MNILYRIRINFITHYPNVININLYIHRNQLFKFYIHRNQVNYKCN